LLPSIFHVLAFSDTWLKSFHSNQLVSFEGISVFRCDRFRAAHEGVALYINKCYKATLVEKSRAGAYSEFVLVSLRCAGVSVLVGSVYNFGEVEAFLSHLSVLSLEYDHLIVLGNFNLDILIKSVQSLTARYREILDSFSMSPFLIPL
jgi:hypothetical protein